MHELAQGLPAYIDLVKLGVGGTLLAFIVLLLGGKWIVTRREFDAAEKNWRERDERLAAERDAAIRNAEEFQQALEKALLNTNEIMAMAQKFDAKIDELQRQIPKGRGHA